MLPSSTDLTYFLEIASTLNLSRAAERLGVSQPSLTLAIQRLEHAVGTALLVRSKKGVTPTQAGKQLLLHTRELLQKWEHAKSIALASTHEIQGSYTIGCHASVALYSLRDILPELLEKHPRLELKLHHDLSRKITESVIRMEIDIGIVVNPIKHPDLIIRKLCTDEVSVWVGEGKHKSQDYRSGEATLICDLELLQTQDLLKKMQKNGIHYRRLLPTSSLELIAELVRAGAGIGVLPGKVASTTDKGALRRIPKAPVFQDEICLLYRVENKSIRAIQAISESIAKALTTA